MSVFYIYFHKLNVYAFYFALLLSPTEGPEEVCGVVIVGRYFGPVYAMVWIYWHQYIKVFMDGT